MKRIDKTRVVAVVAVLIAAVQVALAGVAFWARREADGHLRSAREQVGALSAQVAAARAQAVPPAPPVDSQWSLLESADVSGTLQLVQSLGDGAGITFTSVKATTSTTAGRQSFLIGGTGTPAQVCAFVAAIEVNPRLTVVENGRLTPGAGEQVAFEFGLATYHTGGGQ